MLRDMKPGVPSEPLLDVFAEAPAEFHLGGSHYFGCAREDSDIDLITTHTSDVVQLLKSHGFERMGVARHEYAMPHTYGVFQRGRVQVQVVTDLDSTLLARDILSQHFAAEHYAADNSQRRYVWTRLIETLGDIRFAFNNECDDDILITF